MLERQREYCPFAAIAHGNAAVHRAHGRAGDRQAEPGAVGFALGGEERGKHPIEHVWRNAAGVVADAHHNLAGRLGCVDVDPPVGNMGRAQRIAGIADQVQQHLFDPGGLAKDGREIVGQGDLERLAGGAEAAGSDLGHDGEGTGEPDRGVVGGDRAGEFTQVVDDLRGALRLIGDAAAGFQDGLGVRCGGGWP